MELETSKRKAKRWRRERSIVTRQKRRKRDGRREMGDGRLPGFREKRMEVEPSRENRGKKGRPTMRKENCEVAQKISVPKVHLAGECTE